MSLLKKQPATPAEDIDLTGVDVGGETDVNQPAPQPETEVDISFGDEPQPEPQPEPEQPEETSSSEEAPTEEPKPEEPQPEQQPESSETTPVDEPAPEPEQPQQVEITEEILLKELSEKLGTELSSLDDLKPKELDPDIQAIAEWKEKTGRDLKDFFEYQKDYKALPDEQAAREYLKHKYPSLTDAEIERKMKKDYISSDLDDDDEITDKAINLKIFAEEGRRELDKLRLELGTPDTTKLTPEVQSELDFAKQVKEQMKKNQEAQAEYTQSLTKVSRDLNPLEFSLEDNLSVKYNPSDEDKRSLPEYINTMPGWYNEDGSQNTEAIAKDALLLKNREAIFKMIYEQGLARGEEKKIDALNNVSSPKPNTESQSNESNEIKVDSGIQRVLDRYKTPTIRFGKK